MVSSSEVLKTYSVAWYFAARDLMNSLQFLQPGKAICSLEGGVPGCDAEDGVTVGDLLDVSGVPGLSLSFLMLLLLLTLLLFEKSVAIVELGTILLSILLLTSLVATVLMLWGTAGSPEKKESTQILKKKLNIVIWVGRPRSIAFCYVLRLYKQRFVYLHWNVQHLQLITGRL